jgi:HTH-type transcriptional regulator / antitoxin HipB
MRIRTRAELGALIRDQRNERRLSQKELASEAGVSQHTITDIESGKVSPTIDVVLRCLTALGVGIDITDIPKSEGEAHELLESIIGAHTIGDHDNGR